MSTYIVMGNMRGGTSMVAGLLRILGVNMGDNIDPNNHEDLDLQHRHPLHMRALIDEKNNKHDEWGWKDPMLVNWIDELLFLCDVREPIIFCVFRDVAAIAESLAKHEGWSIQHSFNHAIDQQVKLARFVNSYEGELHLISYEKAMADPKGFISFLAYVVDVELEDDIMKQAEEFMTPGYKSLTPAKG